MSFLSVFCPHKFGFFFIELPSHSHESFLYEKMWMKTDADLIHGSFPTLPSHKRNHKQGYLLACTIKWNRLAYISQLGIYLPCCHQWLLSHFEIPGQKIQLKEKDHFCQSSIIQIDCPSDQFVSHIFPGVSDSLQSCLPEILISCSQSVSLSLFIYLTNWYSCPSHEKSLWVATIIRARHIRFVFIKGDFETTKYNIPLTWNSKEIILSFPRNPFTYYLWGNAIT